jgi:formylglycine-generating enzyme required for sulfatase activity
MNCVDWTHANNYCAFADKRLPSEPEWELAARGTENLVLTWGKGKGPLSPKLLNACGKECKDVFGKGRKWNMMYADEDPYPGTAPANAFPDAASPYGMLNMAGNVMEWTADWFFRYEGSTSVEEDPKPPAEPSDNPRKVSRGGSFLSYATDQVTTYHRVAYPVDFRNVTTGFRCAKSLAKPADDESEEK